MIVLLLIVGVGLLSYPFVSNLINQIQQNKIADGYGEAVAGLTDEELDAMWEQAELYNQDLLKDEVIIDPFDQVKDRKANVAYYETLNPQNNGVMGVVRIPKIDVSLPVYHGTEEKVLQEAVGHLEQTSLPVGGEGTHAVLSGHRGLPTAKLFTDLNLVEEGDVFYLDILNRTLAYQVDQIKVVEPDQLEDLAIARGEDYVTLVTCTPYAINSHRLLVRGTRIPYDPEADKSEEKGMHPLLPYMIALLILLIVLLIGTLVRRRYRRMGRR